VFPHWPHRRRWCRLCELAFRQPFAQPQNAQKTEITPCAEGRPLPASFKCII
jgi:hypothetical protein